MTEVRPSSGKGLGLFAKTCLPKGTVVARMKKPSRMKRIDVEAHLARYGLPHDSIVFSPRSSLVFFDASWTRGSPPRWYRMNHDNRPNTSPRVLDTTLPARRQEIGWTTLHDVTAGEELTYSYENVPADWVH